MKLGVTLDILNQKDTPAFYADTLANRPAAGFTGRVFISTDTLDLYRDTGTTWVLLSPSSTGTITGTGTAGTIPLWNGATTIGNSDLRQLSSEALILNSATDDWPSSNFSNDPGRFLITSAINNPLLVLWGKSAFGSGDEQGSLALGNVSALGSTNFGGAILDGSIENGTDGSGQLTIKTTNSAGSETLALKIDSTQKSTFYNDIILSSGATTKRLILDADVNVARIFSIRTNNLPRWAYRVDGTESGSNTGSDFAIRRYNDAGTFVDAPLSINRATGQSTFAKKVVIENNTGDQQLQLVSSTAPSLRIDDTQTGATKRIGIGLATAINNFIQGAANRDMCIFNGSTTASPMLFGIYDAGTTNTQEAARISAARNFLIGTTTDAGQKLQVSGAGRFTGLLSANTLDITTGTGTFNNLEIDGTNRAIKIWDSISAYQTRLAFTSAGNVGIGNASPTAQLQISGDGIAQNLLRLNHTGSGTNGFLDISVYDTRAVISTNYTSTNIPLEIKSLGNTNQLYLSTAGNVLIGNSTDNGFKLQVNGKAYISGTQNSNLILDQTSGATGEIDIAFTNSGVSGGLIRYINSVNGTTFAFYNYQSGKYMVNMKGNGVINMPNLPTSSSGLSAGDIWNNGGVLNIV
jgi:hypothetical protein